MRLLFINPNTSPGFTAKVNAIASRHAAPGTEIVAVNPTAGPRSAATAAVTAAAACLSDRRHGEAGQNENRQGCQEQLAE